MTPEQFAYWLNGYVETSGCKVPNEEEWIVIVNTLEQVFKSKYVS